MKGREIPQTLVEKVHGILREHVGENDPIHSQNIARILQMGDEGSGTPGTRAIITELLRQGVCVGATPQGYFLINSEDELDRYTLDLERRERAIRARIVAVRRAFFDGPVKKGEDPRWVPDDPEER